MDLSIVIVSWNVKDKLLENLKSIYQSQGNFSFEIIVIDNNSQDDTVNMVKKTFFDVVLVANKENLGFAKACNQGIKQAKGNYVLLLNPDMRLQSDTLINFLAWFRANPEVAVASCKLIDKQGNLIRHVRRFPQFIDQLAIVLKLPHVIPSLLNRYLYKDFDYNKAQTVDSVRGAFFCLNRRALDDDILLDERYFLWFEEVDFCRHLKSLGKQVWYTPVASAIDYVGQSFSQVKSRRTQKYFSNSMLKYFRKWQPAWQFVLLWLIWQPMLVLAGLKDLLVLKSKVKT